MTEIARTYLGNIHESTDLAKLVAIETCLEIYLSQSDRAKGRIHAHTDTGTVVGIVKSRDRTLESGDVFKTESEKLILIYLREQKQLVLDFSRVRGAVNPAQLIYVGHVLGNHHYPISIQEPNKIYVKLTSEPAIIEKLIKEIQIPGLHIEHDR